MKGWSKSETVPESGTVMPIIMRMVEVLPEPLGPRRPNMRAGLDGEAEVIYGDLGVVCLADMLQFNDGHGILRK